MRSGALVVACSMGLSNFAGHEPESSICLTFQSLLIWESSLVETFRASFLGLFHFPVVVVGSLMSILHLLNNLSPILYEKGCRKSNTQNIDWSMLCPPADPLVLRIRKWLPYICRQLGSFLFSYLELNNRGMLPCFSFSPHNHLWILLRVRPWIHPSQDLCMRARFWGNGWLVYHFKGGSCLFSGHQTNLKLSLPILSESPWQPSHRNNVLLLGEGEGRVTRLNQSLVH